MRNILYLHGFCASSKSWKAQIVKNAMAEKDLLDYFFCPDLHFQPKKAIQQVFEIVERHENLGIIGSSLGAHYASVAAETYIDKNIPVVLLNPAVIAKIDLSLFLGEHENLYSAEKFNFTESDAKDLKNQIVPPTPSRYWLLQELGDEVLNPSDAQAWFCGAKTTLFAGGDHSFTRFADCVAEILAWIANFPR